MILVLSQEENEILRSVSDIGLSAQTLMSYLLDVFGCIQIVVQECGKKEDTESIDEVIAVQDEESAEEAEV
jgi:hypothetical protein